MKALTTLMIVVFLHLQGCGNDGAHDPCQDVSCNQPPADSCRDATVLLDYPALGSCEADTGACNYVPTEVTCEHGCAAGRCLAEDKCRGVVCDQPPDNTCQDGDTLRVYAAVGSCDADTGSCTYPADALRYGWEGEVWLVVDVTRNGEVSRVKVDRSSGYPILDRAAARTVRKWQFEPARVGSEPVDGSVRVPVRFKIRRT